LHRVCNRCNAQIQNAPLINFYEGLLQAKINSVEGLKSRKALTKAKVEHLKNEHFLITKEMENEDVESIKQVEKLMTEYQKGQESISKQKEKYKSLKAVLSSEEY
jgi:hypothetical protein